MNHTLLRCCAALLLVGFGLFWYNPAQASISCTITSTPNVAFGSNVNPLSPSPTDTSGTISYTCSNNDLLSGYAATLCFNVGASVNGATNPRQMRDTAGDTLNYQLYQDSTRSNVWGSQNGPPTPVMVNISLNPTLFGPPTMTSGTLTVYARLFGSQTSATPTLYNDSFTGPTAQLTINQVGQFLGTPPPPGTCGGASGSINFPFTVQATVTPQCFVSASPLNFGNNVGLLTTAVNATTTLGVQCSNGTPYNVGLNGGQNSGGNINARRMVLGANSIAYQLYQNSARSTVWGNTISNNTVAGTGSGNTQSLTVYGSVPAQTTPPAGTYNDTIIVSVTY